MTPYAEYAETEALGNVLHGMCNCVCVCGGGVAGVTQLCRGDPLFTLSRCGSILHP